MKHHFILLASSFFLTAGCFTSETRTARQQSQTVINNIPSSDSSDSVSNGPSGLLASVISKAKEVGETFFWDSKKDAWHNASHYLQKGIALNIAVLGALCTKKLAKQMGSQWTAGSDDDGNVDPDHVYNKPWSGKLLRGSAESGLGTLASLCLVSSLASAAFTFSPNHLSISNQ